MQYDEGVLNAPVVTPQIVQDADCIIVGGASSQGGPCFVVRHFLDSLSDFQTSGCLLKARTCSAAKHDTTE